MDDELVPVKDPSVGTTLVSELVALTGSMGMDIHKWASNDPSILPEGTPQRDLVELNSPDTDALFP